MQKQFEHVFVGLPDGDQLAEVKLIIINLSDKDGRHGLIQRRAVHVDGGTHREDETCHSFVHAVVLLQTSEGDGQGSRAAVCRGRDAAS